MVMITKTHSIPLESFQKAWRISFKLGEKFIADNGFLLLLKHLSKQFYPA